jgi:hypothetical protein
MNFPIARSKQPTHPSRLASPPLAMRRVTLMPLLFGIGLSRDVMACRTRYARLFVQCCSAARLFAVLFSQPFLLTFQLSCETLLLLLRLLDTREEPVLYELVLKDIQPTEAPAAPRTPRVVSDAYVTANCFLIYTTRAPTASSLLVSSIGRVRSIMDLLPAYLRTGSDDESIRAYFVAAHAAVRPLVLVLPGQQFTQ